MLTRSIDIIDPFEPTIEEKIFRSAKRVCIVFAVAAVALSALDLMNIRSVANAAKFVQGNRQRVADLPDLIRSGIQSIALASPSPSAVAMIPRDEIAMTVRPTLTAAIESRITNDASPIAALAAADHMDAVEFAMDSRLSWKNSQSPFAAAPAPAPESAPEPIVLASADPAPLPLPQITPTPVALPMSNAVPFDMAAMPRPAHVISNASPVAELAAARHLDAVEVAMEQPPALATSEPPLVAAPAPAPESAPKPIILASADPAPLQLPQITPTPVSLPMSNTIPLDMVPMPRPAPGAPPPSPAELLQLEGKAYAKAERCLANAVYFEARGEPVSGQIAVAQVVMNRVFSGFYPNEVCAVVYQNANRHLACQFTFACDGKSKIINERGAWARANRIAKQTLDGKLYVAAVGPATHYHAVYVRPNWVREMHKMARYGIHNFYRPIAWGNGADEPVWGTAALAQAKKK